LMNKPSTISCIWMDCEEQMVCRTQRLIGRVPSEDG
jgi:hypothetical protein